MVRKYKCIKEYPGSGVIGNIQSCEEGKYPNLITWSEFWEEVKEEYPKIISFRSKRSPENFVIFYRSTDQCFTALKDLDVGSFTLEHMLTLEHFEIYQVAKDKDTIFTIGDKIEHRLCNNIGNIIKINFLNDIIYFSTTYEESLTGTLLENAIKLKNPLFTTFDGVEIFENQTFAMVQEGSFQLLYPERHYNYPKEFDNWKTFSTKEKALEWIDMNKLKFSKQQIEDSLKDLIIPNWMNSQYVVTQIKKKLGI